MLRNGLALSILAACGGGGGGGDGADGFASIEYVEVPLDVPMGAQRTIAWETPSSPSAPFTSCSAVTPDENFLIPYGKQNRVTGAQIWGATIPEHEEVACPQRMHPTADGGALYVTQLPGRTVVTRISGTGAIAWQHSLTNLSPQAAAPASVVLASGGIAVSHAYLPPPGSVGDPAQFIVVLDGDGNEVRRTELPPIVVASEDSIGDGTGIPAVLALVEREDGALAVSGRYEFGRSIQCESQADPRPPSSSSCSQSALDGLAILIDPDGTIAWERRLGSSYKGGWVQFHHPAFFGDGSLLVAGHMFTDRFGASTPHPVAARYAANGEMEWAHAFPFGKIATATNSSFSGVFPGSTGTIDLMILPKNYPCRLVRMEPDGSFSRVQILEPDTSGRENLCMPAQSVGDGIVFAPARSEYTLALLAP
jgi:hypothetical protein